MTKIFQNRPIIRAKPGLPVLPSGTLLRLKDMVSIDSFEFGQKNLKPAFVKLFERFGIKIKSIQLDLAAKAHLMATSPTFNSFVENRSAIAIIFHYLELYLLISRDGRTLYVLGDAENKAIFSKSAKKGGS